MARGSPVIPAEVETIYRNEQGIRIATEGFPGFYGTIIEVEAFRKRGDPCANQRSERGQTAPMAGGRA